MKTKEEPMVPKSIKFSRKKLEKAIAKGKIRDLAKMCRKQLDLLIKD